MGAVTSEELHLACASNAKYLPHVAALIESLAASNPLQGVSLYLLHDDTVVPELRTRLQAAAERHGLRLVFLQPTPAQVSTLPPARAYPSLIWYRVLLPELLGEIGRVLYLDADTLVLQDLRALWRSELGDTLLGAVAQHRAMDGAQRLTHLGVAADAAYFNSGVLLMNLERMRREQFSQRVISIGSSQAEDIHYPDQDAYNLACGGRWLKLHPKWNCFASVFLSGNAADHAYDSLSFQEAVVSPAILHFEGSLFAKPWNYRCVHPHRHLYRAYRQRTPWPLTKLDGSDLKSRMMGLLSVRQQFFLGRLKRLLN